MNIKEISKLAQTSPASVSRVINSSGYVKEEVRQRIQKILDETGYRPNAFAKALHSKKSNTIGVILPKINASSSGENVSGIDEFFSQKGYSILLGNTNHSVQKELDFIDLFKEKQVDGIILIATVLTKEHQSRIDKYNIPFVIMGQKSLDHTPCILFDEVSAAQQITTYLLDSGRQNIGFIGVDEEDIAVGQDRKQGYSNALKDKNIPFDELLTSVGDFTPEGGYKACETIFANAKKSPNAIFAANDKMAIGAINYLISKGLRVPEDIAVCGVGGGVFAQFFNPKLTTLYYDYWKSGYMASEVLFQQMQKEIDIKQVPKITYVPYELMINESA